ncbi:hypothetical protein GCM10025771_41450 [Niveibacterium umoris]|uniref:Beta-glucanase (GH16 family) n=1 Tax=Niveibacterium umoris TaxID=1193620 RepID=A0A840BNH7_9RHOO|nr:glycoside hydrolase family 16 protein [Niveibacterium umoris]MBB4014855.1 beta-glucanase (GH16 family) [Niveibacterium umoris]
MCRTPLLLLTLLCTACGGPHAEAPAADPGSPAIDEAGGLPAGYALVWSDEFNTDGLPDPAKWGYDTHRNKLGWYNDERQYYAAERARNARVEGGRLVIEAHRETLDPASFPDYGGQAYTAARLLSRNAGKWTYGFFEVRAKLACGRGTWPAIWMLSAPPATQWPDDGEIDIMEHVGYEPGVVHGSVHTKACYHSIGTHKTAQTRFADACDAFHRYQLLWTPQRITIGVDDRAYFQFRNDGTGDRATWPFDKPQYLLLNMAVGGTWGGLKGIDDAAFPANMEIDYVRVYQREAQ